MLKVPERFRVTSGIYGTTAEAGNNGLFMVKLARNQTLRVICSDQLGWEHVSVSRADRIPTWDEMAAIKRMFWGPEDVVVEYHVAEEDHINLAANCLHLWRPLEIEIPRPPDLMVGIASLGTLK